MVQTYGIAYAITACLIWGLIFIVPQFMIGFSFIEIALGRYFFYGVVSGFVLLKTRWERPGRYSLAIWGQAMLFSMTSTFLYYTCLILALRYATPAVCALLLGLCPITSSVYGAWRERERHFRHLILPSLLILIGLVMINVPYLSQSAMPSSYILGLMFCLVSLACWSWYVVANIHFLKAHPEIASSDWSTLVGVATLVWTAIFGTVLVWMADPNDLVKYTVWTPALGRYLIGSAVLGFFCSWLGAFLWNRASLRLPVSLAGQLTIFETIFGALYVYLLDWRFPPLVECCGILLFLIAITFGIRQSGSKTEVVMDS